MWLFVAIADAAAQSSVPPLAPRGPHPVGCTNVEQDLARVPPGESPELYWRGVSAGGVERYVTSLFVDPANALVATFTAPSDSSLYAQWSGRSLAYALLVCYPTTAGNARADYSPKRDVVVPRMQRGGEPPMLPASPSRMPVLLFTHGYGGSALSAPYLDALIAFASWGYVTVAPFHGDFRYSVFGPDYGGDPDFYVPIWDEFVAMQATRALSLSAALDLVAAHPHWRDRVDLARVGAFGISQGGETIMLAAGAALTNDFLTLGAKHVTRDTRIRAGVGYVPYFGVHSIPAFGAQQRGVDGVTMPYLALSGTDDAVAPIDVTRTALDRLTGVRGQVALQGEGHELDPSTADDIITWTLTFLAAYVLDDAAERATLDAMQSVQGGLNDAKVLYSGGSAANYQGLWWNAAESGWGINLAHQGAQLYATWYTYDEAGQASWLSMLAMRSGGEAFAGDIVETRGSPYDVVPYDPAKVRSSIVGSGSLAFSAAGAGTFAYTAKGVTRSVAITRFSLGGPVPACSYGSSPNFASATNYQDLWWGGPPENGWGLNLTHEGSRIYATWYTFDSDGSPLWLSSLMTASAFGRYSGSVQRASGPPFGPQFDPSRVVLADVGSAELVVTNGNAIQWRYAIGSARGDKPVTRFLFAPPAGTLCH